MVGLHPLGKGMSARVLAASAAVLSAASRPPEPVSTPAGVYRAKDIAESIIKIFGLFLWSLC